MLYNASLNKRVNAIDCFCGAGGLTYGLSKGGINVLAGIDIDPACEYPYTANNEANFILGSITDITGEQIKRNFYEDGYRMLAGCAPCQPFSTYTQNKKIPTKEKWLLLNHFVRLVNDIKPDFITMENVANITREDIFQGFINSLEKLNYYVWYKIIDCSKYAVPQSRQRLVVIASKFKQVKLIDPDHKNIVTVRDVIGSMPPLLAGESSTYDYLHKAAKLSPINQTRIQVSTPGGHWRDWPENLIASCHKSNSGKSYPSVYGRMKWDTVSPTITTQFYGFGNGRFGHPEQDRALSLREGAILQTFPPDYKFSPPGSHVSTRTIGRLIGNAVPVNLGEAIAKSIIVSLT